MDITRFKCPSKVAYQLNTSLIFLRPLSPNELAEADQRAKQHCADYKFAALERAIQVVAICSGLDAAEVRSCYPDDVLAAYEQWAELQAESCPSCDELKDYVRYAIWADNDVIYDGLAIYHSTGPSDYYGKPVSALTAGQLLYYLIVRNAHTDKVESDRKVTRTWLEKQRKKWEVSGNGKR